MAMDRAQLILVALPIFLLCCDLLNIFTSPPPKPHHHHHPEHDHHSHHHHHPEHDHHSHHHHQQELMNPEKTSVLGGRGFGDTVNINFCASCSYKGTAGTMKKMLETSFPGIDVVLENYPPPMPKRLLAKVVPAVQMGVIGIIMGGEHIFPMMGFMTPPSWYYSLRSNRFGSIASTWLLGNFFQSSLQSSGAFEVHCNGELVFSKLKERRFPSEIELKNVIDKTLAKSRAMDSL